jgi:hypothetical protein
MVQITPHWLVPTHANKAAEDTAVTMSQPAKLKSQQKSSANSSNPPLGPNGQPSWGGADHMTVRATLSNCVTGEWYPDAVIFNNHPNGVSVSVSAAGLTASPQP